MSENLKTTTVVTKKYEFAESRQDFSRNSHYDDRPDFDSWGFSFYSYGPWEKAYFSHATSREEAIAIAEKHFGNEITADKGSYKLREILHEVTTIVGPGHSETIERTATVEFHTVSRTTREQEQMWKQYVADQHDLRVARQLINETLGFTRKTA